MGISNEKTPEETVREAVNNYELHLRNTGNVRLSKKILEFLEREDLKEIEDKLIPAAKPHLKTLAAGHLMDICFDLASTIHLFHPSPQKIICFIKSRLLNYDRSLRALFREVLLDILNDKTRFQFNNESLNYIIEELENLDLSFTKVDYPFGTGEFEYFTGKDHLDEAGPLIHSFISVRGFLPTKEEQHKKYLKENFSPELIRAIQSIGFTPDPEASWLDILELKPNAFGIGLNLNAAFKLWRKKG